MTQDDAIFLLGRDGTLERVQLESYDSEAVLQKLIEDYPELLGGEQIDRDSPPQWLLVKREVGVPDGSTSSDRWSADHLLLDQNACLTIVEVKRSTDSRIRREVVGQMLDYAANATLYWPTDRIRALASATCGGPEKLEVSLRHMLGLDGNDDSLAEIENYWRRVDNNLRNGEMRLMFVADELPRELRRVIEFLNEHMPRIEVLGVEVRQFAGQNVRALVPRVIGQTERTRQEKITRPSRKVTLDELVGDCPVWCRTFFEDLFEEANRNGFRVVPGTKGFSVRTVVSGGKLVTLMWGFPRPGSFHRTDPAIDVPVSELDTFQSADEICQSLNQLAPFTLKGGWMTMLL
ncbi:MAG TPA: hypothetical protein VMN76_10425, partial [Acidobacteriota bacterium]|nr:hypothetical protein [Acidobacteriota bacterium]